MTKKQIGSEQVEFKPGDRVFWARRKDTTGPRLTGEVIVVVPAGVHPMKAAREAGIDLSAFVVSGDFSTRKTVGYLVAMTTGSERAKRLLAWPRDGWLHKEVVV